MLIEEPPRAEEGTIIDVRACIIDAMVHLTRSGGQKLLITRFRKGPILGSSSAEAAEAAAAEAAPGKHSNYRHDDFMRIGGRPQQTILERVN